MTNNFFAKWFPANFTPHVGVFFQDELDAATVGFATRKEAIIAAGDEPDQVRSRSGKFVSHVIRVVDLNTFTSINGHWFNTDDTDCLWFCPSTASKNEQEEWDGILEGETPHFFAKWLCNDSRPAGVQFEYQLDNGVLGYPTIKEAIIAAGEEPTPETNSLGGITPYTIYVVDLGKFTYAHWHWYANDEVYPFLYCPMKATWTKQQEWNAMFEVKD